ncbi:hypothetical protein HBI40_039720 [Parastagonospora nodorum]|nr:hypothetical protein HBI40_039720 [Parastagonospora nodorum]
MCIQISFNTPSKPTVLPIHHQNFSDTLIGIALHQSRPPITTSQPHPIHHSIYNPVPHHSTLSPSLHRRINRPPHRPIPHKQPLPHPLKIQAPKITRHRPHLRLEHLDRTLRIDELILHLADPIIPNSPWEPRIQQEKNADDTSRDEHQRAQDLPTQPGFAGFFGLGGEGQVGGLRLNVGGGGGGVEERVAGGVDGCW